MAMVAVPALARMGTGVSDTTRTLQRLLGYVEGNVNRFKPSGFNLGAADNPDRDGDRGRLIAESITIALAYLGDPRAGEELLAILERPEADQRSLVTSGSIPGIEPYNQRFAMEALARLGRRGRSQLARILQSGYDIALRTFALFLLFQSQEADDVLLRTAESATDSPLLRVLATRLLALSEHTRERATSIARMRVERYVSSQRPPRDRSIKTTEALTVYEVTESLKLVGEQESLPVATWIRVIEEARYRRHHETLTLGPPGTLGGRTLNYTPPLLEVALVELGRSEYTNVAWVFENILADIDGPARVEAALALGHSPGVETCRTLVALLDDGDPWVRYAAYRSLRKISGREYFALWLSSDRSTRHEAVAAWTQWLAERTEK